MKLDIGTLIPVIGELLARRGVPRDQASGTASEVIQLATSYDHAQDARMKGIEERLTKVERWMSDVDKGV